MATLVQVKKYFESGRNGRPCSLTEEIKKLTPEDRVELCKELDKLSEEEIAR